MAPKVKEAMRWLSDAAETAAGWATIAIIAYAVLFMDLNGNGRLVDTFSAAAREALGLAPAPRPVAVQTRVVPVRPPDEAKVAQDRMFALPEEPQQEIRVPVAANDQPRPDAMTDAPADASAGKDWRRHLSTKLRTFTVYGRGDETSSASASAANAPSGASGSAAVPAPTPAAAGSAARLGSSAPAAARPGVSSRASKVGQAPADSVRNFR